MGWFIHNKNFFLVVIYFDSRDGIDDYFIAPNSHSKRDKVVLGYHLY
jgi:hypothetical protein